MIEAGLDSLYASGLDLSEPSEATLRRLLSLSFVAMYQRSPEAEAYHRWLHTKRWERFSKRYRAEHPLCKRCEERGLVVPAEDVHHVVHPKVFGALFDGPFEGLCKACHGGPVQQAENRGYALDIGADGMPLDKAHPAWR